MYFKNKASGHHYQAIFHNQQIFCHIDSESKEKNKQNLDKNQEYFF